jgi:hypothetical protein
LRNSRRRDFGIARNQRRRMSFLSVQEAKRL